MTDDVASTGGLRWRQGLWRTVRWVVFPIGLVVGVALGLVLGSFGGGTPNKLAGSAWAYGTLALGVAAPVCWFLATKGKAGDRWTVGYLLTWIAYLGVTYLAVWLL